MDPGLGAVLCDAAGRFSRVNRARMKFPLEGRKWLADRLRKIAADDEAIGTIETAAQFRRLAKESETGRDRRRLKRAARP